MGEDSKIEELGTVISFNKAYNEELMTNTELKWQDLSQLSSAQIETLNAHERLVLNALICVAVEKGGTPSNKEAALRIKLSRSAISKARRKLVQKLGRPGGF